MTKKIHNQKDYSKKRMMFEQFSQEHKLSKTAAFECLHQSSNTTPNTWYDLSVVTDDNIEKCKIVIISQATNIVDIDY